MNLLTGYSLRVIRSIALILFGVSLTLIVLELLLEMIDPFGMVFFTENERYKSSVITVPDYAYVNSPGIGIFQGVEVNINSEGFRGPEFKVHKPPEHKRILILGDSVVFGWGVPQEDILAAQLQDILNERRGPQQNIEVISAAACSWNTRIEYEFLKKRGLDYSPDVLILIMVDNDVLPDKRANTQVDQKELFPSETAQQPTGSTHNIVARSMTYVKQHTYLGRLITLIQTRPQFLTQLATLYTTPDSPQLKDARLALEGIVKLCQDNEVPLVLFLYGDESSNFSTAFLDYYREYLQAQDTPYHLFPTELFAPHLRNSFADSHVNAGGLRIMAQAIFEALPPEIFNGESADQRQNLSVGLVTH